MADLSTLERVREEAHRRVLEAIALQNQRIQLINCSESYQQTELLNHGK